MEIDPDRGIMDGNKNFQQFLNEKMEQIQSQTVVTPLRRRPSQTINHYNWTPILRHGPVINFSPKTNPYPKTVSKRRRQPGTKSRRHRDATEREAPVPKENVAPREKKISYFQLPPQAQLAFKELQSIGALLDKAAVGQKDLKQEFRRLAKSCHPDRHPSKSEEFIQLKKWESILSQSLQELL